MKNKALLTVIILTLLLPLFSEEKIQKKDFILKGKKYSADVEPGVFGSDIFITNEKRKNISILTPGENLFPEVFPRGDHYFVTWIHYKKNDVKLAFHNSKDNSTRMLIKGGFKFISSETKLIFQRNIPRFVLFRGIYEKENEDIFIFDLLKDKLARITDTEGNEKNIVINSEDIGRIGSFIIKTKTLYKNYIYEIGIKDLSVIKISEKEIIRGGKISGPMISERGYNTIVAFGDSITWGKMRMNDLIGESHPELTYWYKASEYLTDNYGKTYTVNLGVNGDSSQMGVDRMDTNFRYVSAYYLLVLFGTNDVGGGGFSSNSTKENLDWIMENAIETYNMFPVISTVPPQKLYLPGIQFYKNETEELNKKIIKMAEDNNYPYIDPYTAFFQHPEGWEAMLEDSKGNHPSPTGHQVMADLVVPKLLSAPPGKPEGISFENSGSGALNITCDENVEFDFSHYKVMFGFQPDKLNRDISSESNIFSLITLPVGSDLRNTIYFKIQAVDKDNNVSDFTEIFSSDI
ncbi:MAG: SGNH/GDSL hydrolase family protein [Acidobacteriota bacterium]